MYVFDDLRNKYPEESTRINEAEKFFTRLFDKETMEKIFSSEKENSKLFYIGYNGLKEKNLKLYNKCMAYYEQWLSYDMDSLPSLLPKDADVVKFCSGCDYQEHKEKFFERLNKFLKELENER